MTWLFFSEHHKMPVPSKSMFQSYLPSRGFSSITIPGGTRKAFPLPYDEVNICAGGTAYC